jgi:NAD(P)H dehydrogenase (quinone)
MNQVIIVYASDYGNTKSMAESIEHGANSVPSTHAIVKQAEEVTTDDLLASDAIVIGSPVHMGTLDWRVKKFIDHVCSNFGSKML